MLFKNLAVYRLPADWQLSAADLEERLITRRLQPCGHFEMSSRGWVRVTREDRLVHAVSGQLIICLGVEQKLLPASIIRQQALERAEAQAIEQGFPVGRRQMRDIRLKVTEELRSRALCRRRTTRAWIDAANGWFVIDAAGGARADEVVEALRDTLGSFAVLPLESDRSPQSAMATWLLAGEAPAPLRIDEELELKGQNKSRAAIRYSRHPVALEIVREHLASGLAPTRLGLSWRDRIAFVLTEKLQIKRVQFLGLQEDPGEETTSPAAQEADQFDATMTLMTGELAQLLPDLAQALGGSDTAHRAAA